MPNLLSRRKFLVGLGGFSLALPFMEAFADDKSSKNHPAKGTINKQMNAVFVGGSLGFNPDNFFPTQSGSHYQLPAIFSAWQQQRNDMTFFSNLDHGEYGRGGHEGTHTWLTGVNHQKSSNFVNGSISLDQAMAAYSGVNSRYASLQFSTGKNTLWSWSKDGIQQPSLTNPQVAFDLLFKQHTPKALLAMREKIKTRGSILDLVYQQAKNSKKRISKRDGEQLEQYFSAIRSAEQQITREQKWMDQPKPISNYADANGDVPSNHNYQDLLNINYDLMALALETQQSHVVSLDHSHLPSDHGLAITRGYHQLSHHGQVESFVNELSLIEQTQINALQRFMQRLKTSNSYDGKSLFDNTMILVGSGLGNANSHSNRKLPMLLAGGGFKHGEHKVYEKNTPACNLYASMLQKFTQNQSPQQRESALVNDNIIFGSGTGTLNNLHFS